MSEFVRSAELSRLAAMFHPRQTGPTEWLCPCPWHINGGTYNHISMATCRRCGRPLRITPEFNLDSLDNTDQNRKA